MSTERAASTSVGAAHQLGRAAAEVDHEVGPGHADRLQVAGRAGERQRASSSPATTSGATPRSPNASRTPATNSPALRASRDAEVATKRTRSTPSARHCSAYSRARRSVRAIASGAMTPVRSTPCPSRTISIRRTTSVEPAVVADVGDEQADRVGAAVDRGDAGPDAVAHGALPASVVSRSSRAAAPGASAEQGCRCHHGVEHRERLVAERVDPGPGGERVGDEHVQALDPGRHAAGGDARDLGHVAELGAAREVVARAPR